jgi:diaminopimelate decarboxylase
LAPLRGGTGADIYFSYKTNPVPAVLRRLHEHGIGAEVISEYELWLALRLGVAPERIIYNGPSKSDASLRLAVQRRVRLVNANSAAEVVRIARIAAEEGIEANVGLRVALASTWSGQFGITAGSRQLHDAVRAALDAPLVRLVGFHAHRGGTIRAESEWGDHVTSVLDAARALHAATGWWPEVVDVGGSLACATTAAVPERQFRLNRALGTDLLPPDPVDAVSIARAGQVAVTIVQVAASAAGLPVPELVLEPGRALTADAQFLLTSVVDVKDDVVPYHAIVDAGSNLADPLPDDYHQLFSVSQPDRPAGRSYRLAGPICTPADVIYNNWRLPELEPGQVLAIMDAGAYFVPFSRSFSFPQPGIVGIDNGAVVPLRRPETAEDLVARDEASMASWRER